MALSTMRFALRPCLRGSQLLCMKGSPSLSLKGSQSLVARTAPMATAHEEMKQFWEKNQRLNRPNSPWTIYRFHLPMTTSLTHRITGIAMGVVLYGGSIGIAAAPGDFASYIEFVKGLEINTALMFSMKTIAAFPLIYHYLNGIRHLTWDAGIGLGLNQQYKTGTVAMLTAFSLSAFVASLSYWAF